MRSRVRLLAVMFLLVGLAFVQDPGYLVSDTKFDLAVSPVHFLERALHLWDDEGAFGQLQNQAYGYLWPMGPFFALLHVVDVPGWVAQRLWQALVLCVSFLGTARLARALGLRSDAACLAAGLAFALSPRMLTVLGPISIEAWPSALAPWALLALVRGSSTGSPRRAAALAGLAVAMVGGVNAAATFAVLPLGVVWVLTRTAGPRRRSLMIWWPLFTLLGTLWWLVPLLVMGAYSPPFLDYIETTTVTTFPTTLFDALRGTSNWVPYVSGDSRAGNDLLTTAYLSLNSGILLLVGFAGVLDRRNPHRLFLALSVVVGLLMVTAGHVGAVHGVFGESLRVLLDGSLAPLRNVHKFDPIIRLPLVLGLGFVIDQVLASRRAAATEPPREGSAGLEQQLARVNRGTVLAMVLIGLVGSTLPALSGRLEPAAPVASVPAYWKDAARWLDDHDADGTALLAPGSGFGEYLWGSPRDEPLQFLARSPWAVRNAIPLAPTGNIRMLDAIEDRFAQGQGSRGFAAYLRRNGVGFLVVRNDLRPSNDVPDPVLVHQALADSPGLERVASFGPQVGGGAHLVRKGVRTVVNGGWQARYPAVEVFAVPRLPVSGDAAPPTVVAGGPEDLLDLADLDVLGPQPVVLAADVAEAQGLDPTESALVLTDGLRKRERYYARVHDGYSAVLTPGDRPRGLNPRRDYTDPGDDRWATTGRWEGARAISASSSGSDSDVPAGTRRGELPFAAVDGDEETEWVSNPARENRTWWQITLPDRREVDEVTVTPGARSDQNQTVRVRTENGVSEEVTAGPGEAATLSLPDGATGWIRVESPGSANRSLSLAEVSFEGRDVRRVLELPPTPVRWGNPRAVVLRADVDARRGCAEVAGRVRCAEERTRTSEESAGASRRFTLASDGSYVPALRVRPRVGAALTALVTRRLPVNIAGSSTATTDPRGTPLAAIDGDPATTWTAKAADFRPSLSLNWLGTRSLTGIRITTDDDTAARRPRALTLVWPGGRREVELGSDGRASFPRIRTSQLRLQVDEAEFATNLGFDSRSTQMGVGIQELRLTGLPYLPVAPSTQTQNAGCGSGPTVGVNGQERPTAVRATPAALLTGATLPASLCTPDGSELPEREGLELLSGANDVIVDGSEAFDFVSLTLRDPETPEVQVPAGRQKLTVQSPGQVTLVPPTDARVANLGQNRNDGWRATQDGRALEAVTLNGWQQGWLLAADEPVRAFFAPDRLYRTGLALGFLAFLGLLAAALVRRGRHAFEPPALGDASMPWLAGQGVAAVAALLLAGWPGLLVAVVVSLTVGVLRPRVPDVLPWVFAAGCFVASFGYFVSPWGDSEGWAGDQVWPHYLVLVPVLAGVLLAAGDRRRSFRRIAGASTSR